jgi:hypothetical protein
MTGHKIKIAGYRIDKAGKLVKSTAHLDASKRLQQRRSKKIKVVRR